MKPITFTIKKESQNEQVAETLLKLSKRYSIFLFFGELGAGKTTLIKAFCKSAGVEPNLVNSPTYNLINEYPASQSTIFHMDLYRLKNVEELEDIGFYYYIEQGICLIEWPQIVQDYIEDYKKICINIAFNNTHRTVKIQP